MKRFSVLAACLLSFALLSSAHGEDSQKAEKDLRNAFPQFSFDSFRESPVKDIYEIIAGDQIFYFSPEGYLFFGEIWSKDGVSITARRKEEVMAAKAKELPLDKAVKIGSGKNVVVEFTDPDCPHCRKAYEYLSKRSDITRYVFFFPLDEIHPEASGKAKYVLCAGNPGQAYDEVMSGKLDGRKPELPAGCNKEGILNEHIKVGQRVGVRGTPAFFVNGTFISGANMPLIEKLLAE
jgi:thiol:disulfide interchange protein DsbC